MDPLSIALIVTSAVGVSTAATVSGVVLARKRKQEQESGAWACDDGACVSVAKGTGTWDNEDDCRCGMCVDGECKPTDSGGAYKSVEECEKDDASRCTPELGWGCVETAGNPQSCAQVVGGEAKSFDECRCWTCAGKPPGPQSGCMFDARGGAKYATRESCFMNEEDKCGWKYACPK